MLPFLCLLIAAAIQHVYLSQNPCASFRVVGNHHIVQGLTPSFEARRLKNRDLGISSCKLLVFEPPRLLHYLKPPRTLLRSPYVDIYNLPAYTKFRHLCGHNLPTRLALYPWS